MNSGILFASLSFFTSYILTLFLVKFLPKMNLIDIPNDRSNHKIEKPRGGGIAILITIMIYFYVVKYFHMPTKFSDEIIYSVLILSAISLIDDFKSISYIIRILSQITAVSLVLYKIPSDKLLFKGYINLDIDRIVSLILIVWFINLYNFMDGIDGITSVETIHIFSCLLFIDFIYEDNLYFIDYIVVIFSMLGFLRWNWQPAKIFLGDVGSVTLGFLSAIMLFDLALKDSILIAAIIPLYYLADSGITLFKRIIRKERFWQAHNQHFYQNSVRILKSHYKTVLIIICFNLFLFFMCVFYFMNNVLSFIFSIAGVSIELFILQNMRLKIANK